MSFVLPDVVRTDAVKTKTTLLYKGLGNILLECLDTVPATIQLLGSSVGISSLIIPPIPIRLQLIFGRDFLYKMKIKLEK